VSWCGILKVLRVAIFGSLNIKFGRGWSANDDAKTTGTAQTATQEA